MSFVPPLFSDLGKSAADLFKKKYDYKNVIQLKNKTKAGLTFTSSGDVSAKGVGATVKVNYKNDSFGEGETEIKTSGQTKLQVKAKKLFPGVVVTVTGDTNPKEHDKIASVKTQVDYQQDFFSGSASVDTSFFDYTLLTGAGVIGFDGLSVGGELKLDANNRSEIEDYNVGAQYDQPEYTVTVKTSSKGEQLAASYFQKVSAAHQVGAEVSTKLDGSDERKAVLGTEYKVDDVTSFKVKGEAGFKTTGTTGLLAGVLEQRLKDPRVLFSLSTSYTVDNISKYTPKDFGVSVSFGDE
jgi:hypothetical protein